MKKHILVLSYFFALNLALALSIMPNPCESLKAHYQLQHAQYTSLHNKQQSAKNEYLNDLRILKIKHNQEESNLTVRYKTLEGELARCLNNNSGGRAGNSAQLCADLKKRVSTAKNNFQKAVAENKNERNKLTKSYNAQNKRLLSDLKEIRAALLKTKSSLDECTNKYAGSAPSKKQSSLSNVYIQDLRFGANRELIASVGYSPCAANATIHFNARKEVNSYGYCTSPGIPHEGTDIPTPSCGRTRENDYFLSAVVVGNVIPPDTACQAMIKITDVNLGRLDNTVNNFQLYFSSLGYSEIHTYQVDKNLGIIRVIEEPPVIMPIYPELSSETVVESVSIPDDISLPLPEIIEEEVAEE